MMFLKPPSSSRPRRLSVMIAALLLVALHDPIACANPLDAFGFGARSSSMGGAVTAVVNDFSANYYNPAALAIADDLRLEIGYAFTQPELLINGQDLGVDASRGVQGGIVIPGRIFDHRIGFSVALFLPDKHVTRVRALPEDQPRFVLYDNRPQRLIIATSLSFEILKDTLMLGAGLTYMAHTRGTLDMVGEVDLASAERTTLLSAVDVSLDSVRYPSVGVLFTPGDHWRFGLTYREAFALELELGVDVSGDIVSFGRPLLDDGSFTLVTTDRNHFSPRQLQLGVAYQGLRWLLSVDVAWLQWSEFPAPTAEITIDFDLGDLPLSLPPVAKPRSPGFHDIVVPRLGAEILAVDAEHVDLFARAGYFFEPSPAPDQRGDTNYVDAHKHGLSLGTSLTLEDITAVFPKPISFDLTGQLVILQERSYVKENPADATGDFVAQGMIWGLTFTTTLLF